MIDCYEKLGKLSTEAFRKECEIRYWINQGYRTKEKLHELELRIAKKRGAESAKRLINSIQDTLRGNQGDMF